VGDDVRVVVGALCMRVLGPRLEGPKVARVLMSKSGHARRSRGLFEIVKPGTGPAHPHALFAPRLLRGGSRAAQIRARSSISGVTIPRSRPRLLRSLCAPPPLSPSFLLLSNLRFLNTYHEQPSNVLRTPERRDLRGLG
jgi:hypothetical protein